MIESQRLVLRVPEAGDLVWQIAELNSAAVMRHLGGPRDEPAIAASFAKDRAALLNGDYGFWTVALRETGEPIGKCGLALIYTQAAPEEIRGGVQIGWTLAERFWGHGYASEAAQAVIAHGFDVLGLPAIWSQTSDSNPASTRVMAKLGFERCAALDYTDADYPPEDNPTTVYRITRKS
jgi:RimJ/RimL family protein N-acetyltransferase